MAEQYKPLSSEQIKTLEKQHCYCENWQNVSVVEGFRAEKVKNVSFSGNVKLGKFEGNINFYGNVPKPAGIYNAHLHNCTIGNNCYIANITNHIANYLIEDDCVIDHLDLLAVEGLSTFGNNTFADVINEAGGRSIPVFDGLSAQIGYVMAVYRHRKDVLEKLFKMAENYAKSVESSTGIVGKGAVLSNCGTIKNVKIGAYAIIGNMKRLENGTILSCKEDKTEVGANVMARNFIFAEGAKISDGSIISDCFIGQAVHLSKQFSAENSVFFANCGLHHGEACSIFAGPYTVTHHKATLLIAGLFSFFNAGSGSNQSNHMYKTGSVHQGVLERGTKTTSDSYIMYPARIGAFSVVMGRHYAHPDTTDIPFSYLYEEDGKSYIVPGINLRTVGIIRDGNKWPQRDERKAGTKTDLIVFDVLSPYTVQKICNGLEMLLNLQPSGANSSKQVVCNNLHFNCNALEKGIEYYKMAIAKFLGNCLADKIENCNFKNIDSIAEQIENSAQLSCSKWLDIAGLLTPADKVEQILTDIAEEKLTNLAAVAKAFGQLYENYKEYKWQWAAKKIYEILQDNADNTAKQNIINILTDWQKANASLTELILADGRKEFSTAAQIGFGTDGDTQAKFADFEAVRGKYEDNSFVKKLQTVCSEQNRRAELLLSKICEF